MIRSSESDRSARLLPVVQALGQGQCLEMPVSWQKNMISVLDNGILCMCPRFRSNGMDKARQLLRLQFEAGTDYQQVQVAVNQGGQLCLLMWVQDLDALSVPRLLEVMAPALNLLSQVGLSVQDMV
jgi:hypothetical protein